MAGSSNEYTSALSSNKTWAKSTADSLPDLFPTLAAGQHPSILWLGCSDSRVPETTVLGLKPGDVFVHRNIANVLPITDLSSQAVIQFAVANLKVKHVVVCGHTSCGGAAAALGNSRLGVIDCWLLPLRRLRMRLSQTVEGWEGLDAKEKAARLIEANVREGVETVREHPDVVAAVKAGTLHVHGAVYDVACGELKEIDVHEDGAAAEKVARDGAFHIN